MLCWIVEKRESEDRYEIPTADTTVDGNEVLGGASVDHDFSAPSVLWDVPVVKVEDLLKACGSSFA